MLGPAVGGQLLDRGQRNLLAAQFGEALDPAENDHETVGVDPRDVAGIVPAKAAFGARRVQLARLFGQQIAQHDVRSPHA